MESRDQQYLRILTSGPSGPEDFEAVRYLKDKGLTDSPVRISRIKESFNKAIDVVWMGPNSSGIDFIEELRARAYLDKPNTVSNVNTDKQTSPVRPPIAKEKNQSQLITMAFSVLGMLVFAAIVWLLKEHFGIPL